VDYFKLQHYPGRLAVAETDEAWRSGDRSGRF
jgi:hypothetical protein